ncbi:MAG: polymer-forming cytoskeletal protein [Candidatus Acidiferrales bacterium]
MLDAVVIKPILLKCNRLTIGPEAKATGVVIAQEVIVYGEFTGNLRAIDRIEIKANAFVNGDLTARNIVIESGAIFSGTVQIERRKSPRGAPALAKSAGR